MKRATIYLFGCSVGATPEEAKADDRYLHIWLREHLLGPWPKSSPKRVRAVVLTAAPKTGAYRIASLAHGDAFTHRITEVATAHPVGEVCGAGWQKLTGLPLSGRFNARLVPWRKA